MEKGESNLRLDRLKNVTAYDVLDWAYMLVYVMILMLLVFTAYCCPIEIPCITLHTKAVCDRYCKALGNMWERYVTGRLRCCCGTHPKRCRCGRPIIKYTTPPHTNTHNHFTGELV